MDYHWGYDESANWLGGKCGCAVCRDAGGAGSEGVVGDGGADRGAGDWVGEYDNWDFAEVADVADWVFDAGAVVAIDQWADVYVGGEFGAGLPGGWLFGRATGLDCDEFGELGGVCSV